MKSRIFKNLLALSLVLCLSLTSVISVLGLELPSLSSSSGLVSDVKINSNRDDYFTLKDNITAIENELSLNGTDVVTQLNNQIRDLKLDLSNSLSADDRNNINKLISTTERLIDDYNQYAGSNNLEGSFHPIYSPAVASVIAWFNMKGYLLSAELLTHARDNNILDSWYDYPKYGDRVLKSPVLYNIISDSSTQGSNEFPNTGSTEERDLYYAIHSFVYIKENGVIYIGDRYDFAWGDYDGIAGIAVDTMYLAQQAGTIVPFWTLIAVQYK